MSLPIATGVSSNTSITNEGSLPVVNTSGTQSGLPVNSLGAVSTLTHRRLTEIISESDFGESEDFQFKLQQKIGKIRSKPRRRRTSLVDLCSEMDRKYGLGEGCWEATCTQNTIDDIAILSVSSEDYDIEQSEHKVAAVWIKRLTLAVHKSSHEPSPNNGNGWWILEEPVETLVVPETVPCACGCGKNVATKSPHKCPLCKGRLFAGFCMDTESEGYTEEVPERTGWCKGCTIKKTQGIPLINSNNSIDNN